jgi:hypothetical protein
VPIENDPDLCGAQRSGIINLTVESLTFPMNVPVHGKRKGNSIVRAHYSVRERFRWVRFK